MTKKLFVLLLLFLPVSLSSQNIDIRILRSLNSSQTLPSDKFFQFVSNSDAYIVLGIPAAIGTVGLIKHDDQLFRNACVTLAATAVNFGVTAVMKYSFNRDRPFITYPDITRKSDGGSPSFPSGHTSMAFATATSLTLAYPKWYIIVPSYTWASTVGYSRMHLGVHYPSDVLIGALVGAGSAWLSYAVNKKLNNNSRK
ncbi:MAG: phosphatase PAP2 family protein [Bacteroidetes bacterium]|nr:phosphatase PAP2 family protein [Bacteroidota bacterium]